MPHDFKKEHEGKRMLIRKRYSGSNPDEVTIKEFAPSMEHMKVQWVSSSCTWEDCEDYSIVEILECPPVQFHGIPGGA